MFLRKDVDTLASKTPRKDKDGNIIAYQIEVYRGRDSEGKKLKPYSTTWKIPDNWKSPAKIQKELDRVAVQFELDCKAGTVPLEKKTFKQYSDYVMELKERDNKHRTIHRYKQLLVRINEEIGHMKLTDINGEHLNRLYIKLGKPGANKNTGKPLSPQTIQHHHRVIHLIFTQAVKEKLFMYNIADTSTPPKVEKNEADFFELEEVLAIRVALHKQPLKWQAIVSLLIDTGARRAEILGLKWGDIYFENNQIHIQRDLLYTSERGIFEDTTKTKEKRIVNIAPEITDLIKAYKIEMLEYRIGCGSAWTETGFCFTKDTGLPMNRNSINNWLDRFSKNNSLPKIHPHKFRHTQASLLYATGENPIVISKRLGHKQVSTTQNIYSHMLEGGDRSASEKLAALLYRQDDVSIK